MSTIVTRAGKGSALTHNEVDANFVNLNTDKLEASTTSTLTNKTINLTSNTLTGTTAQFNTALSDGDFATLAGTETLTNKTITSPTITGGALNGTLGATTPSTVAATTISASGVSTFSAGSVGAPAITTTGDTNTGIFFPAADTIAFAEGGVESMRIDSSGHVNIGITSGSSDTPLLVYESANANRYIVMHNPNTGNASAAGLQIQGATGGDLRLLSYSSAHTTQPSNATILNHNATGSLLFGTNGLERYRIDNKGNLQNSLTMSNSLFRQVSRSGGNATETFTAVNMGMSDNVTALINVSVGGTSTFHEYGGTLIYWYMPRGADSAIQQTIVAAFKGASTSTFSISVSGNSLVVSKDSDLAVSITIIGGGGNSTI
jgi:hypothetical protein